MVKISSKRIIRLNKKFGGSLLNQNSLDFSVDKSNKEKNIYKSNAYLIRGIIVDHSFLDGNKRTAMTIVSERFSKHKIKCDKEKLTKGFINIAKKNVNSIDKISRRLKKWCKKS